MFKVVVFSLVFSVAWVSAAVCHNPADRGLPLQTYHLTNRHHLHGSFLMMQADSVFLETGKGGVCVLPLSRFSRADQLHFLGQMATIAQVNQPISTKNRGAVVDCQPWYTRWASVGVWLLLGAFLFMSAYFVIGKKAIWAVAVASVGAAMLVAFKSDSIKKMLGTDPLFMDAAFQPFKPQVATHWDDNWFYVESNGLPTTHSMMTGITKWQQQVPLPQCYTGANAWQIPLNPVIAAQPVPVNDQHFLRGAIAIATNGIPIFNPHTNTGVDAYLDGQLDQWGGHSGRADDYHYHVAPLFLDTQSVEILPIAFALDGFAVYAGREPDGSTMLPLDANHGHFDASGVYHYHGTLEAPYLIGNMVGQVTEDATLQIIPQAKAKPVRPSLTPLTGATITDFEPNLHGNGYILTYTRNGSTFKVDYSWTSGGVYTYQFMAPTGTTTETYNGQVPCTTVVATDAPGGNSAMVAVFPNPSSGRISLRATGTLGVEQLSSLRGVTVFDMNGRRVFQQENPGLMLDVGRLARGVYILSLEFVGGTVCRKIIFE
jgi:hypothetical protein